jgi:hypothetical protein
MSGFSSTSSSLLLSYPPYLTPAEGPPPALLEVLNLDQEEGAKLADAFTYSQDKRLSIDSLQPYDQLGS